MHCAPQMQNLRTRPAFRSRPATMDLEPTTLPPQTKENSKTIPCTRYGPNKAPPVTAIGARRDREIPPSSITCQGCAAIISTHRISMRPVSLSPPQPGCCCHPQRVVPRQKQRTCVARRRTGKEIQPDSTSIVRKIKNLLQDEYGVSHSTIEVECEDCADE